MELPIRVLVKLRVNPRRAAELREVGLAQINRTAEQDLELRLKQQREAREIGRRPFRGQRQDRTGTFRPDSGTPIFGWNPEGRVNVCLQQTISDLQANLGLTITQVNLLQKPGDMMANLVIKLEREGERIMLTPPQALAVEQMTSRAWEHLHGFRNPDKSWTFNAAHRMPINQGTKDVRVYPDGSVRCEDR